MTTLTSSFPVVKTIRRIRCPEGQRLWEEIDRAKVGGNPGEIRRAVTAYFTHKNGGFSNRNKTKYEPPCLDCDEARQP